MAPIQAAAGDRLVPDPASETAERRQLEQRLAERERIIADIEDVAGIGIWEWDIVTDAIVWSERQRRLHGIEGDGGPAGFDAFIRFVHPDDRQRVIAEVAQLRQAGQPFTFRYRVLLEDGTVRWLMGHGRMLRNAAGDATRMVGTSQDLTELHEAEGALHRAKLELEQRVRERTEELAAANRALEHEIVEHRAARDELVYRTKELEGLFQALPDVYLRLQADGLVTDFRRGSDAERYPAPDGFPEHLVGRRVSEFLPPHLQAPLLGLLETVRRTQKVATVEYPLEVAGERREFENRIAPLPDDTLLCVIRDITKRKRTEASLALAKEEAERAREAAERANRAKSEFLSRMSHELRTPMNSILGFAQVLERADLPASNAKSVQHILRAGRHLLHLINEVLEIARIEAGRHHLSLEPVRIGTVLREAITMVRPLAAQWSVRLEEPPDRECNRFVHADRQRLAQVVLNLLSNAIKYNVAGGAVRITCGDAADATGGERLTVRVEDTGRGIDSNRIDQLFTPFARLGAEASDVEGTGLGLALSQRLTEAMGGALRLDRTGPGGSVFALDLRTAEDPLIRAGDIAAGRRDDERDNHRPALLLYIEDNLANLSLVETILLTRPEWQTLPALQGQIGLELARQHTPDLILLDLHLPDMQGDEVMRRLRADPRTALIPIVMISADATRATVDRLLAAGAAAFLTKPIDIDEFLDTVESLLAQRPDGSRP